MSAVMSRNMKKSLCFIIILPIVTRHPIISKKLENQISNGQVYEMEQCFDSSVTEHENGSSYSVLRKLTIVKHEK